METRSLIQQVSLVDLIDSDPRPAFIVDLSARPPSIVYTSPALFNDISLRGILSPLQQQNAQLWEWIGQIRMERQNSQTLFFAGLLWTRVIIQQTWLVISANERVSSDEPLYSMSPPLTSSSINTDSISATPSGSSGSPVPKLPTRNSSLQPPALIDRRTNSTPGEILPSIAAAIASTPADLPVAEPLRRATTDPGWIVPDIGTTEQRPFLDVINSVDWAATPLGPMSEWTPRLQQIVNQILADSRPIAIYWGKEYSTIYNEAFSKLCGSKHPFLLGRPVEETWPEGGEHLKAAMRTSAEKRRASTEDEWRHFVDKGLDTGPEECRWSEEVYLKWSVVPLYEDDDCLGFMHPVVETTSMRLWERRMKMLIELGEVLVTPRDVKSYWTTIIGKLEAVEPRYDIPLAILYSVEDDPDAAMSGNRKYESTKICRLEGSLGVPEGHPIIPHTLAMWSSDEGLSPMFREALVAPHPLLLQTDDGSLPSALIDGLQWRGFGDPCRAAVVLPIRPTKEENVMGLLFLGLNPRRPYDNDYQQYISLLSQKITTSLASTVLLEEEARRGRNMAEQAAYDQAMLKEKLDEQTKEATESIQKFEAVAEFIPVGMCFGDNQGNITFANDAFCRITGLSLDGLLPGQGYLPCVVDADRSAVASAYDALQSRQTVTFEFRVKAHDMGDSSAVPTRNSPSFERAGLDFVAINNQTERHVLASAKAERAVDGSIVRVLTCLTDVTLHKQTAEEAIRRAQQAENLKRMAEFATVGMYDMDLQGRLLGANNVFFEMCGVEKVDPATVVVKPWELCLDEADYPMLREKLKSMVAERKVQNVEVRFKNAWVAEDGAGHTIKAPRWVQATLMPVQDSEGVIKSFTGCLSDVSLQKWQLEREKERKEEALESKRQQENFIDMTSHEMRNPLSAIIHCADAVTATLTKVKELVTAKTPTLLFTTEMQPEQDEPEDMYSEEQELIDSCIENAEIIVTCAQHQKRIVDDILTMSKLDSQLLAITPITVDTIDVVQEALKMFEVEARRVDIDLGMIVDQSYHDLGMRYLEFDPSRLKQVLINLLTNALKFTKTGPTRSVTVTMSASRTRPTDGNTSVQFIPRAKEAQDEDSSLHERRNGENPIWLIFEVKDTGQGLTEEEMKSLFQRFVQASSRTHVKYGGSGLGLFISRRLTELQNGAIGVASVPGVGSTFAFFIEAHVPTPEAIKEAESAVAAARELSASTMLIPLTRTTRTGSTTADRLTPTSSPRASPSLSGLSKPAVSGSKLSQTSAAKTTDIEGVLIVEDNIINQHITRRGLNDYYRTDVANHGIEALEKVRQSDRYVDSAADESAGLSLPSPPLPSPIVATSSTPSPEKSRKDKDRNSPNQDKFPLSVILMDIEMPIQDGLTCTRHIREMERQGRIKGGRIPIIAVSANARAEQVQEAKEAGCDGVLVKPFRMHELIAKMEVVVREVAGSSSASA
jgi:PAS domain S-box-containing protein